MHSWLDRVGELTAGIRTSHRAQVAASAIISGVLVAVSIVGFQAVNQRSRARRLKRSIDPNVEDLEPVADHIAEYQAHDVLKSANSGIDAHCFVEAAGDRNSTVLPIEQDPEDRRLALLATRARHGAYDNELILEQLARNRVFLTDAGLDRLRSSFIIVIGLGGVGSHATAALARSGVARMRLVDFDQVTLSSLNRHAVATLADVGTPKVNCLCKRLEQISPWIQFDCRNELFSGDTAAKQLEPWNKDGQAPDFVIDAIDNIDSKVTLLKYCHDNKIEVISSMGAGCKSDPTRVFIGDISASTEDPLSRSTRRRLKQLGISNGIAVVFSTEKASPGKAQLMPLPDDEFRKGKVNELGLLPDFRVRILPVLGTIPAVFGLCIANHIMLQLTGYPNEYLQSKGREKMYDGILANLQGTEERLARFAGEDANGLRIPINQDDVSYLVEEVYRGRSAVSGLPTRLTLIRWRRDDDHPFTVNREHAGQQHSPLSLNILVCMTKEEAARHERDILKGDKTPEQIYDSATLDLVNRRMEEEKLYANYR